jgi:hypothetical protein
MGNFAHGRGVSFVLIQVQPTCSDVGLFAISCDQTRRSGQNVP